MDLISLKFALSLLVLLGAYYAVGRFAQRWQWVVLLAGSMAFYGVMGSWPTLLFLLAVAFLSWVAGLTLHRLEQQGRAARKQAQGRDAKKQVKQAFARKRRIVFWFSFALVASFLLYFKYTNVLLYYVHLAETVTSLNIILPLGISFYTFQALGYVIDSYNAKFEPERNFARYLLFISWFPQIIQGPINRFDQLAHQLFEPHAPNGEQLERGLLRLGFGILKKVGIANVLFNVVWATTKVAAGPQIPGSLALFGIVVYSLQMYADFSGGIDIVEGMSELFGITMAQNFRQPYFSVSLSDFWRRWHMSLGAWMRDYVFYPLAVTAPMRNFGKRMGKRLGKHAGRTLPACAANIIVFLLVGVWHGADAHYVAWGLYNGFVVALSDLCAPLFNKLSDRLHIRRESAGFYVFRVVRTFAVVCVGRYFDCFNHVGDALHALVNLFTNFPCPSFVNALSSYGVTYASEWGFPLPIWPAILLVLAVDVLYERGHDVRSDVLGLRLPARLALYGVVTLTILSAATFDTTSGGGGFLYANF